MAGGKAKFKHRKVDDGSVAVKHGSRKYLVTHYDDYGVIVRGTIDVNEARPVLKYLGYKRVKRLAYRPTMVDQTPREWPNGLATGGTPAVAFYFDNGG